MIEMLLDLETTPEEPGTEIIRCETFDDRYYRVRLPIGADFYLPSVSAVHQNVPVGYNGLHEYQLHRADTIGLALAKQHLADLAERGSRVHAGIERYNKIAMANANGHGALFGQSLRREDADGPPYTNDEWRAIGRYAQWFNSVNARVIASEMTVYWLPDSASQPRHRLSPKQGFAGTLDAILEIDYEVDVASGAGTTETGAPKKRRKREKRIERRVIILDVKTSKAINKEHRNQVATYLTATHYLFGPDGIVPADALAGVLALNTPTRKGYTLSIVEDPQGEASDFLDRLRCFYNEFPEFHPKTQILPTELTPPRYTGGHHD